MADLPSSSDGKPGGPATKPSGSGPAKPAGSRPASGGPPRGPQKRTYEASLPEARTATRVAAPPPGARRPLPPGSKAASMDGNPLVMLGVLVFLVLVLAFVYAMIFQAEFTDNIAGYKSPSGTAAPNLMSRLAVGLSSGKELTITEEDINRYLSATLRGKQSGPPLGDPAFTAVGVRLVDGHIEILVERRLFGRRHTMATHFVLVQKTENGSVSWMLDTDGGKFGRLPVNGIFLKLGWRPLLRLANAYDQELRILKHASSLRVEDHRILIGPIQTEKH